MASTQPRFRIGQRLYILFENATSRICSSVPYYEPGKAFAAAQQGLRSGAGWKTAKILTEHPSIG